MGGKGLRVFHAEAQAAQCPGIRKRNDADRHGSPASVGGSLGHHRKADTAFDEAAYGVEAGQSDAQPELTSCSGGMTIDMVL
jgi:hypothetical protein